MINVAVLGDGGVPIAGLGPEDFVVEEDGEERDVGLVLALTGAPLDIGLVLDLSGSMVDTPWRQRAADFLGMLNPQKDCVYLLGFSSGVGRSLWGRPDNSALVSSLEMSRTGGGTALYDAVVFAANQLAGAGGIDLTGLLEAWEHDLGEDGGGRSDAPAPLLTGGCPVASDPVAALDPTRRRRRALVVVTDGEDSGSSHKDHHARLAALAGGLPVFHVEVAAAGARRSGGPRFGQTSRSPSRPTGGIGFARMVEETGGTRIRASPQAYEELLNHLRGFYVVGYYVPRADPSITAEIAEHEIELDLNEVDGDVLYPRFTYRPTVDRVRVRLEVAEAERQLVAGDLTAARFAADNAVAADPSSGAARFLRATIFERLERLDDAYEDAILAADLAPGDPEIHRFAMRMALAQGQVAVGWEQAIRAAQAGARMFDEFEELARRMPVPEDFLSRIDAPELALVVGASREGDLFARAALPKAMRSVAQAISDAPYLALAPQRSSFTFTVRVSDKSVEDEAPRKFRGQITVLDPAGKEIYDEGFTLDDLDDPAANAEDLAKHIEKIVEKAWAAGR